MSVLVSILIPVYNTALYLRQCLDSVINQSYQNLQIVIVDDGSEDDSLSICQEYARNDQRIEVYHKENAGVAAARNDLLSHLKGDFFLFVDSDDWIESDTIEFFVHRQHESNADIVTCSIENYYGDTDCKVSKDYHHIIYTKEKAIERFLYHREFRGSLCNKLISSKLIHEERFDGSVSCGEDALFCWHVMQNAEIIIVTDRILYHYLMNDGSLMHSKFGDKKLSSHFVWEQICEETKRWWPQFLQVALARHCVEDTLLLRDAAYSGYHEMTNVRMLQDTIKGTWKNLNGIDMTSTKMKVYAWLSSRYYCIAGMI